MSNRKSWHKYFIDIAKDVSTRSTCLRRNIGAVIVKDKRILTTGYNGAFHRYKHCIDVGKCLKGDMPSGTGHSLCNAVHAEMNAIVQAAKFGISLDGASMYITTPPCSLCTKLIIQSGIKDIFCIGSYPDEKSIEQLNFAGIKIIRLDD